MGDLTQDDYKNLITFLNRTNLKGNESQVLAILMQKISVLAQNKEVKPKKNPPTPSGPERKG